MLKVYVIFCFILYAEVKGQTFRSDYKYYEQVRGWVKFHSIPAVWNDARLRCHAEGSVLASPVKEDLASIMFGLMKENEVSPIFTGIHATYHKGDYASIEGIPLQDIPKLKGKLDIDNKNNEEECLIMFSSGTLVDDKCQNVHPYICYKAYDPLMLEPNECGTIDNKYIYSSVTGHCYKFHTTGQPWNLAYMICAAEGGHLAIINSEKEAEVLKELYAKYPSIGIIGQIDHKDWAHIGFKSDNYNNIWVTIHGQSLEDAGYANWAKHSGGGEPDNSTTYFPEGQHCGNVHRTAVIGDNYCGVTSPFICEKDPDSLK